MLDSDLFGEGAALHVRVLKEHGKRCKAHERPEGERWEFDQGGNTLRDATGRTEGGETQFLRASCADFNCSAAIIVKAEDLSALAARVLEYKTIEKKRPGV